MHTIEIDMAFNRVQVVLNGLMTVDEVVACAHDLRHRMVKAGMRQGYGIVVDVSGCSIQTQGAIHSMGEQIAAIPKARAIAVFSVSALARLQIRRLFQQPYARVVSSMYDGYAWVTDGIEPPADLPPALTPA